MGKGRIISAHGEGRYTIEIVEDRARAESARALAVQRVAELDGRINDLEQALSDWQAEVDLAAQVQNEEIADYQQAVADGGETPNEEQKQAIAEARQAMTDAAENLMAIARERDAVRTQQRLLEVQRAAAQSRIDRIDALPPLRQIEAWCADYTEDLSGEVATAEVPGEVGQVIIKPGFEDANQWSPSADGAIQPALAGTSASVFYNLAMMPGWQRWRPTFRIATISNIDNDLCDITLDLATSSQQGLNVNAQGSYSGVPIMYMDCNGDAFKDGDRVLVAFSGSTDAPMVVGFEREPKECGFERFASMFECISDGTIPSAISYSESSRYYTYNTDADGNPFETHTDYSKSADMMVRAFGGISGNGAKSDEITTTCTVEGSETPSEADVYMQYSIRGSGSVSVSVTPARASGSTSKDVDFTSRLKMPGDVTIERVASLRSSSSYSRAWGPNYNAAPGKFKDMYSATALDTITLGELTVDVHAVSVWASDEPWGVAIVADAGGGSFRIAPFQRGMVEMIHVKRGQKEEFVAVSLHRAEIASNVASYLIGFEKKNEKWARADVPEWLRNAFINRSRWASYIGESSSFVSVPADIG